MRTALQNHRARLRERHKQHAEANAKVRRVILLQDRSFLPMRQEGMRAHGDGRLRSENPYLPNSAAFVNWDVGWRDANDSER